MIVIFCLGFIFRIGKYWKFFLGEKLDKYGVCLVCVFFFKGYILFNFYVFWLFFIVFEYYILSFIVVIIRRVILI